MSPKLLFVCIENSNRSQMAEAFARFYGEGRIEAFSAGSNPSGKVNPKAIEAMAMLGYDLNNHTSKSLHDIPDSEYTYVVTMGCGEQCPWIPAREHLDWEIPDPRDMDMTNFISVRNLIAKKVKDLLKHITQTYIPPGYSRLSPYLIVKDVKSSLEFMRSAFDGDIIEELKDSDGSIRHGEIKIGDAVCMFGKSADLQSTNHNMNYLFCEDVDLTYKKAISAGATSISYPDDKFYGYREAGVVDPDGNTWWISTYIKTVSKEQMEEKLNQS